MPTIQRIYQSIVWLRGTSLQGKATEIDLGEIEYEIDDEARTGLIGIVPAIAGVQLPSATITFDAWDTLWYEVAANHRRRVDLQFRGVLSNVANAVGANEVPYIVNLAGIPTKVPIGEFSPQEAGEWEIEINYDYCRKLVNGTETLKYNARTNEWVVNGVDLWANTRAILGT